MSAQILTNRIHELIEIHGGLRKASRNVGIDAGYLKRLSDGDKANPSDEVLRKLGLTKHVEYKVLTGNAG